MIAKCGEDEGSEDAKATSNALVEADEGAKMECCDCNFIFVPPIEV